MTGNAVAAPGAVSLQAILGDPTAEWQRPAKVGEALARQAVAALAKWPERYQPATRETKLQWLVELGLAVAGNFTPADAAAKAELMARLVEHPVCCFSEASFRRVAAKFKFWPSYAELKEALDAELHRQKTFEARLRALLRPAPQIEQPRTGKTWAEMTDDERAAAEAAKAEALSALAAARPATGTATENPKARAVREAAHRVADALSVRQPVPMGEEIPQQEQQHAEA